MQNFNNCICYLNPYNKVTNLENITVPGLQIRVCIPNLAFKTYVVDTQKNRLIETVLLSTQNKC